MPRHHRILHVRQEISSAGGDVSVLQAVLDADVERNSLMEEERSLLQRLEGEQVTQDGEDAVGAASAKARLEKLKLRAAPRESSEDASAENGHTATFATDLKRLDEVYERLRILGSDAAEARAATILSGLQFTPAMQAGPTSALSGGWRMRVALAAALFVEPDLLMLDEVRVLSGSCIGAASCRLLQQGQIRREAAPSRDLRKFIQG